MKDFQARAEALLERDDLNPEQIARLIGMAARTSTPGRQHFRYLSALEFRLAPKKPPPHHGGRMGVNPRCKEGSMVEDRCHRTMALRGRRSCFQ